MCLQESKTYINNLDTELRHSVGIERLAGSSVLITGATGTIGSFVADMLLRYNQISNAKIKLCVAGRNIQKLQMRYGIWKDPQLTIVRYNILEPICFDQKIEYVIHVAGNAHPTAFNGDPVGTIIGNVNGTYNLLQYAKIHGGKRLLYVSSGEVYGQGDLNLEEFHEEYAGYIDTAAPRSCYPESKRATENLCASYSSQYKFETVIVRPCHTYGPEITPTDNRANVQFIRNALNGEDIVLKSTGSQIRSYNYVGDCASGIITVLLNGKSGEAYNLANPYVHISISELAAIIANAVGKKVVFSNPSMVDIANRTPITKQVLSSKKLEALGWNPAFSIIDGIENTLRILRERLEETT